MSQEKDAVEDLWTCGNDEGAPLGVSSRQYLHQRLMYCFTPSGLDYRRLDLELLCIQRSYA